VDLGIWATWYNLMDKSRDAYLEWAHATYLQLTDNRAADLAGMT
jgi:hypothetical protein